MSVAEVSSIENEVMLLGKSVPAWTAAETEAVSSFASCLTAGSCPVNPGFGQAGPGVGQSATTRRARN